MLTEEKHRNQRMSRIRLIFLLLLSGIVFISQAATLQDARIQYQSGKLKTALAEADEILKSDPQSITALFLKAQIQSESQNLDKAIETYKVLITLDSGHLQAYNNLAALYAQQGKLELASVTLEQAIRTDPIYMTIHTNLRAIYMDMSKKHYRQALKLKPVNSSTQFASIDLDINTDQILSEEVQVVPQSIQDAINTTVVSHTDIRPSTPRVVESPEPKKSVQPPKVVSKPAQPPIKKPEPAVSKKVVAVAKKEAKPKAEPKPKVEPVSTAKPVAEKPRLEPKKDPAHEVKKGLLSWANAWSNRDAARYVKAYIENYATANKTHKDWAAGRRWNFKNKKYIKVSLSNIHIQADGNQYRAKFKQSYESDSYQDVVNKEILFIHQGGSWKIKKETTK